jgi:hypothetical protein
MASLKDQHPAEGHTCCINRYDEETIMVPFKERELWRLISSLKRTITALEATGDFPESKEYYATYNNLTTAHWMVTYGKSQSNSKA